MPPHVTQPTPAQRLRRLLGVQDKRSPRVLLRHRHGARVDALEPRVMLSAEWMTLPGALDRQQTFVVEPSFSPEVSASTFAPVIDGLSRQAQEDKTNEVLFVDAAVQDSQQLVSDLLTSRSNSQSPTFMEVVVLDSARDGLSQVGQWLAQRSDIRAVHIISHGADGVLQLGSSVLDAQTLDARAAQVAAWSQALSADADLMIYGCDVAQSAAGQSMLERLARLTGADVAASVDVTGGAAADWDLEFHTGAIEATSLSAQGYRATLAMAAADLKLGNDDADLNDSSKVSLQEQWSAALTALEAALDAALGQNLANQKLPGLNLSINEMLRLDSAAGTGETLIDWQLATIANDYFVQADAAGGADLAGLAQALEEGIHDLLRPTGTSSDLPWAVDVTAEVLNLDGTPTARLGLDLSVLDSRSRNVVQSTIGAVGEGALPAVTGFDGSEFGFLSTRVSAVLSARIDMAMAGLDAPQDGVGYAYGGANNGATQANEATILHIDRFELAMQAKSEAPTSPSYALDMSVGLSARLRAADGSLGITLSDWLSNGSNRLDVQRQSSLVGQVVEGNLPQDLTAYDTSTKGLMGVWQDGLFKVQAVNDIALTGAMRNAFNNILDAMARLGSQIDGQAEFNVSLPMADLTYNQLLTLNDGRTLGDVLAFKLAGGGNVLSDYIARTDTPTLTGLLDRMRQYLSGTGDYSGLEAIMSAELAANFLSASGFSGQTATVRLNGTLSRQFMARFGFNGMLDDVSLAFALGQGVPMQQSVGIDMLWSVALDNTTAQAQVTDSTVEINTLTVNVDAVGSTVANPEYRYTAPGENRLNGMPAAAVNNLDAPVVIGMLDARLQGTLNFQTDTVVLSVNGGNAMDIADIYSVAQINDSRADDNVSNDRNALVALANSTRWNPEIANWAQHWWGEWYIDSYGNWESGAPRVYASADLTLAGDLAGTPLSTLAGATPRIVAFHDAYRDGAASDSRYAHDWQDLGTVNSEALVLHKTGFAGLQKFAAINATDLTQLYGDVGYFLEQLRKTDQFTTALPFTDVTLGQAVDFSALMNQLVNTQFKELVNSGVSGTSRVSPVLTRDLGFTLRLQREGDAFDTDVNVVIRAADTAGFNDVRQLAALIDKTVAQAMGGIMLYNADGDDVLPTGPSAEVTEQVTGGLSVANTISHEVQKIKLHASSGDYRVSLNGTDWSGPIAVHGSAKALQNALESLPGVGKGNVLVTGIGKNLTVEFVGDLDGRDMDLLQVRFEGNATAGGWLDVIATNFQSSGTQLTGMLNFFESVPNTFSKLEIRPTAGVAIDPVQEGNASNDEIQRVTIVNGGGGSFTLSGSFKSKNFTTEAISLEGAGDWSSRIQTALREALLDADLSEEDSQLVSVLPAVITLPDGVQAFDVRFAEREDQSLMTADFSVMLGRSGIGFAAYQLQAARPGVGDTPGANEVQRLVFDNVQGGLFSLTLGLAEKFVQTNDITWVAASGSLTEQAAAAQMAQTLQAEIFKILKQGDPGLTSDQIEVVAVTGLAAGVRAFDVHFIGTQGFGFCNCESPGDTLYRGDLQGADVPQFEVNTYGLTAANARAGQQSLTGLGFGGGGAESQQGEITTFSSLMEVMGRVQTFVNAHLPEGTEFNIDPRYDAATQSFLFDIQLVDARLQSVSLSLPDTVGDAAGGEGVSGLDAKGSLDLSTQAVFEATIGMDLRELLPFDVVASGVPVGIIRSSLPIEIASATTEFELSPSDIAFDLQVDNRSYAVNTGSAYVTGTRVSGPQGSQTTHYRTSLQGIVNRINAVLDATQLASSDPLYVQGFRQLGQLVNASVEAVGSGRYAIKFTSNGSIERFGLTTSRDNLMAELLGFDTNNRVYVQAPSGTILPEDGVLSSDAHFSIVFDVNAPAVNVTIDRARTLDNTSRNDLVADINNVLAATSVTANAYLGSGGLGFSHLGQLVKAQLTVKNSGSVDQVLLGFMTQSTRIASMDIQSAGFFDSASQELGLRDTQSAQTRGAEIFLQDARISGQWQTRMYDLTPQDTTDANLKYEGVASLGMLALDFGSILVDSAGAFSFELLNPPEVPTSDRMVLNTLFDKVDLQSAQIGMGSPVTVKNKDVTLVLPIVEQGRLNTDVALKIELGAGTDAPLTLAVAVRKADTASNTGREDLAADVNAAIVAALRTALDERADDSAYAIYDVWLADGGMPLFVSSESIAKPSMDLDLTNPALDDASRPIDVLVLKKVSLGSQAVSWKVTPSRLSSEIMTEIAFTGADGEGDPTAELTLGRLKANGWWLFEGGAENGEPSEAYALRDANTVVRLQVDNMAAVLAGDRPMALQSVIPPNGLGIYTPLKDVSWTRVADQLGALGDLFSDLGGMGANGVLAQALPMVNANLSEIFNFADAFAGVQDRLAAYETLQLQDLKAMLMDVFGVTAEDILLNLETDSEGVTTALRIQLPFAVQVDLTDRFQWLLDPKLRALVAGLQFDADGEEDTPETVNGATFLANLLGAMSGMGDDKGKAPTRLLGTALFQLDFGIDLSGTWKDSFGAPIPYDEVATSANTPVVFEGSERFGQVYLVDREETSTGREGTFLSLGLSSNTSGMAFDSNMGLFTARVNKGSLALDVDAVVRIDSQERQDPSDETSAEVTRTWLSDYNDLVNEATASSNARTRTVQEVATLVDTTTTEGVTTTVMLPLAVSNGVTEFQLLNADGASQGALLLQAGDSLQDVLDQLASEVQEQLSLSQADVLNVRLNTKVTSLAVVNTSEDGPQAWLDDLGQLQIERGASFQLTYNFRTTAGLLQMATETIDWAEDSSLEDLSFALFQALNSAQTADATVYSGPVLMVSLLAENALVVRMPTGWTLQTQDVQTLLVDLTRDGRFGLKVDTPSTPATDVVRESVAGASSDDVLADLQAALVEVGLSELLSLQQVQLFALKMPNNVSMTGVEVQSLDDSASLNRAWFDANGGLNVTGESAYRLSFDLSTRNELNAVEVTSFTTDWIAADASATGIAQALAAALDDAGNPYADSGNRALTVTAASEAVYLLRAASDVTVSAIKGRDLAQDEVDAYRADRLAVTLDGSLRVALPMSVVFSSGLAKLAEQAPEEMGLGNFVNPMPIGTLEAEFNDLGSWMAYKGGAAFTGTTEVGSDPSDTLLSVYLAEAIPPDPNASGNGAGDPPVPEGTPVDQDYEDQLRQVQPDPYRILASNGGGLIDGGGGGNGGNNEGGADNNTPDPDVFDISLTLPNFKYWQDVAAQLIALSGADGCDPDEPENPGLLMLLRDPAQVVDTIDQILAQIQTQLNNLFGDISLPFIQTQLAGAIGFIDELRVDLLGALREAIESTYKMYGGVDNALRMFMFDALTTDMNRDWVIDETDMAMEGYNLFLNFLRDFNGDDAITPDDIVIEYLLTADSEEEEEEEEPADGEGDGETDGGEGETDGGEGETDGGDGGTDGGDAETDGGDGETDGGDGETDGEAPTDDEEEEEEVEYAVDMADLSWSAGRRAAWVTSGINEALLSMVEPDGSDYGDDFEGFIALDDAEAEEPTLIEDAHAIFSVLQAQDYGDYKLLLKVPSLDAYGQLVLDEHGEPALTDVMTQELAFDADAQAIQQALILALSVALPGIQVTQDDVEVIELVNPEADPESEDVPARLFAIRLAEALNEKFADYHAQMFVPVEEGAVYEALGDEQTLTAMLGIDYGDSCYTSHAGKVVLDASFDDSIEEMAGVWTGSTGQTDEEKEDAVRQAVRETVLEEAKAIQFRMNLGQTYEWAQDLSFDLGLDAIPLELSLSGELVLEVKWDVFLGFGIDLDEGFYLVTRSMDRAGIGAVTNINAPDGYSENEGDEHIANLWQIEEEEEEDEAIDLATFDMDSFLGMFEAPEEPELPETEEIIISANVFLRGLDTDGDGEEDTPASLNGRLLFLGGQLTDLWTDTIKNTEAEDVEVSEDMAWGEEGRGSRTQLYAFFKIDITDGTGGDDEEAAADDGGDAPADGEGDAPAEGDTPAEGDGTDGATDAPADEAAPEFADDGRLTFAKFMEADLTDLFEISWKALAQVNLNAKLGQSVGAPLDYLPTIQTEFHLYWGMGSEDGPEEEKEDPKSQMAKLAEGLGFELPEGEEEPEYFDLFSTTPTIWFSDVRLDLGTFFTEFMMPVADRVFQVIGPLIPVIKALTTPIPGLSQLMGKDYTAVDLAVDMAKLFGGETKVEFIVAVVKMVRTLIDMYEDVSANGGNFAIPIAEVLVLNAAEDEEGGDDGEKPEVEEKGDKEEALSDAEKALPEEGSAKDTTDDLEDNADSPGSALAFPFLEDLFGTTIDLLLGNPVDLVTFTPPDLVVEVKFRFGAKIFYIFDVGIGGSLKFGARLTFGYDTYGIMKFLETKQVLDIFDGFYVSDNVVNGVDLPEIFLETKLGVYVGLDLGIVKIGIMGGIKLTGGINLCDPNKDGKIRPSEFIQIIQEDPAALVSVEVTLGAFILFYIEVLFLKFEFTIVDVVLFKWEYNPCDRQPVLAVMDGTDLVFNTGSGIGEIDGNEGIRQTAEDRRYRNTDDGNEQYVLTGSDGDIRIDAVLPNGQSYNQSFSGVQRVRGYAGAGNDVFDASAIDIPVYFVGGSGDDVLIGGAADDTLIGGTDSSLLQGNEGDDLLVARGGETLMHGHEGDDTYRMLSGWGDATIGEPVGDALRTDSEGRNVIDFTAQQLGVTIDDAHHNAFQGDNTITWTGATTVDQIWGGQGDDRLDFSGNEANLLVTVTGMSRSDLNVNSYSDTLMGRDSGWTVDEKTNAGWVTHTATGMQQSNLTAGSEQRAVNHNEGFGFKFVGIENIIGGQGSDAFRIRDGASVTGSLHGDTATGLYHDGSGNENANARNTIDFSEYTEGVRVDQENYSAFGVAGASRIVVRGMHNMFGGQDADYLAGDGRNNLIVGNDSADTLEGRSAHDLLVADNFLTWMNVLPRPSNGTVVSSYIALEDVGQRAEFGGDGRRWVWLGQSLENRSLTTTGQTLRGGTGNDIQMGALGSDLFNDGGTGEGNDTIMADLGRMRVDFTYRTPLYVESFGRRGGGNDTINLGTGSNIVIAGAGDDTVSGNDQADSFNIVMGDNAAIKFQSVYTDVGGSSNNWTLRANLQDPDAPGYSNHMIEYIRAEQDEAPEDGRLDDVQVGQAGKDVINLSSGSGVVFGGWGADTITFGAKASVESNTRYIAGDHAEVIGDDNGGIVAFRTLDTARVNGGDDFIQVGDQNDSLGRDLGRNYVLAGMAADTVLISAGLDDAGVLRFGAARSEDVVVGDNGEMLRTESVVGDELIPNLMLRLQTTQNDKGDADRIALAHGTKVVLGGVGGDTIEALDGDHLVLGDNGRLDYDSVADNGVLRTVTTTDIVIGGDDRITLGEGYTLVAGGKGNDTVEVSATRAGDASGLAVRDEDGNLRYVAGVLGVATVRTAGDDAAIALDNSGRTGRFISGDNTTLTFDNQGGLIAMVSTDPIAATGGADTIRIGTANTVGFDIGVQAVVGGMADDQIEISAFAVSSDVLLGDNGDLRRASRAYGLTSVVSTRTESGGADSIRTGAGDKIVIGGFGADVISAATLDDVRLGGDTPTTAVANRSIVLGDSGQVLFDLSGAAALAEVSSLAQAIGGNDTVSLGDGDVTFVGGYGNDSLSVTPSKLAASAMRVAFGDNALLRYAGMADKSAQAENLVEAQTLDQTVATGGADTLTVGRAGASMGQALLVGGMGADSLTVLGSTAASVLMGDNGLVTVDQVEAAPSVSGQQTLFWSNGQAENGVSQIRRVESLLPEQGTGDSLSTINGMAVLVGGAGADRISAGRGQAVAFGDGAQITYADGALREARSFGLSSGLGDTIELGAGSGADGHKVVVGGAGGDTLTVSSAQGPSSEANARIERVLAGDNATLGFDDQGRLVTMETLDADIATAGNDALTVLIAGSDVDRMGDAVFAAGGLGDDRVVVNASGKTVTVASGDNLQMTRRSGEGYALQSAIVNQPSKGGNDLLRLGSGTVLAFGGVGHDQIDIASKADDQVVALGDAGYALFEVGVEQEWLSQIGTTMETTGGNDTLSVGAGRVVAVGGAGRDTVALRAADGDIRVVLGDTGQIDFAQGEVHLVQSTQDGADAALNADTLVLPADGQNLVIGGTGPDTLSAIVNAASRYMPGSGMLENTANGVQVVSVTVLGNPDEFGMRIGAEGQGDFPALSDDYELVRRDPVAGGTDDGSSQTLELTLFGEGEVTAGQTLSANGRIAYPALKSGLATFAPVLLVGEFGTLDLRKDGSWAYVLGPGNDTVDPAQAAEPHRETFYIQTTDGSVTTVTVEVKGPAQRLVDWQTRDAVEDTGVANNVAGVVSIGHVSLASGVSFNGQQITNLKTGAFAGQYGSLVVSRDGSYAYVLDQAAVDHLPQGIVVTDDFSEMYSYTNAQGEIQTGVVVVRVQGGNDNPLLSLNGQSNEVRVDVSSAQDLSGRMVYEDVDLGDSLTLTVELVGVQDAQGEDLPLSQIQRQLLRNAFTASRVNDAGTNRLVGVVNWTFNPTVQTLAMIPAGQTVRIQFDLVLTDELQATHRLPVMLVAEGANDAPSFGGDMRKVMLASDGQIAGQAIVADADVGEARFVEQVLQGQFGVLTLQEDGRWTYQIDGQLSLPPGASLVENFVLATRDASGQGNKPVIQIVIQTPTLIISTSSATGGASAAGTGAAVSNPANQPAAMNTAATPATGNQTQTQAPLVVTLGNTTGDPALGLLNPAIVPTAVGISVIGTSQLTQRPGAASDPATESSEPQQPTAPVQPQVVAPAAGGQAAAEQPETRAQADQPAGVIEEAMNFTGNDGLALSALGAAAAMTLGKGQRIQWQSDKKAQPSRQRIQW